MVDFRDTVGRRYIVDVRNVSPVQMRCIKVDHPDGLFLVGRTMITTHNTDGVLGKWAIKAQRYGIGFNGIFFRKEMPQADDLIERAKEIYLPHWRRVA